MRLRLFFDAGSGVCLWAGDERAREKYGYPLDLDALPLTAETIELGNALTERFDGGINWDDPAEPSTWSDVDREEFFASRKVSGKNCD